MKKQIIFTIFISIVILIMGCQQSIGEESSLKGAETLESSSNTILKAIDYYPFHKNKVFYFEGIGNEFAEQYYFVEFIDENNKAQIKILNPATNLIKIVQYIDGEVVEVYSEGEFYHIENMLGSGSNNKNIILKEPLVVGNSWLNSEGNIREITALDTLIKTPYDELNALEVTTSLDGGAKIMEYYVKDIGLVARIFENDGISIKTLLKFIEEKPLNQRIMVFYPLFSDTKSIYIEDEIFFYTNMRIEDIFEDKFKYPPMDDFIAPLLSDVRINSIYLDRGNEWTVNIDLSKEFLDSMNSGTSLEYEIIMSIVNTLGKFYDSGRVNILIDGKVYESGHISNKDGFLVNTDGIEKINK